MGKILIKKAIKTDAKDLTELTIRSKSYWGYGEKQIEEWTKELTIAENYVEENNIYKLIIDNLLVGFYAYKAKNETTVKLNYLFVEPKHIGQGYGKILIQSFLQRIEGSKYESVVLDADPNAEKFYAKLGFRVIGRLKSSIKNRYLPIMELKLKHRQNMVDIIL